MTERACFSNTPLGQPIKCRPRLSISFDLKNQPGCHEIANWKTENGKLIPSGNNTIRISNSLIQSISANIGPSSAAFHIEWTPRNAGPTIGGAFLEPYTCNEMSSDSIDKYLNFEKEVTYPIIRNAYVTIKWKCHPFFIQMLDNFTRSDTDTYNLADPQDESKFNDSLSNDPEHPLCSPKEYVYSNIPSLATICINSGKGAGQTREYSIELKLFVDMPTDEARKLQSKLMASELSHIHEQELRRRRDVSRESTSPQVDEIFKKRRAAWFGLNLGSFGSEQKIEIEQLGSPYLPIQTKGYEENIKILLGRSINKDEEKIVKTIADHERSIARQEGNIYRYLISQVSLERGERIQYEVLKGAAKINASRISIIENIRNQLDKKLVPANFWGEKREDLNSEKHQHRIMKILEWMANGNLSTNPIRYIRFLRERAIPLLTSLKQNKASIAILQYAKLSTDAMKETTCKMALQLGIGNCGEHSVVSFETLKALIASNPQKYLPILKNIIRADLQNGDHAFVLGGFAIEKLFYESKKAGSLYWNLDEQLKASGPGEPGFVLDTYIEEVHNMTAVDFKEYLKKKANPKDDNPIIFQMHWLEQYPAPTPTEIIN